MSYAFDPAKVPLLLGSRKAAPTWGTFDILNETAHKLSVELRGNCSGTAAADQYKTWPSLQLAAKHWDKLLSGCGYKQDACKRAADRLTPFWMEVTNRPDTAFANGLVKWLDSTFRNMLNEAGEIFWLAMKQTEPNADFPFNGADLVDPATSKFAIAIQQKQENLDTGAALQDYNASAGAETDARLAYLEKCMAKANDGRRTSPIKQEPNAQRKRRGAADAAEDPKTKKPRGAANAFEFFDGFSYIDGELLVFGPQRKRLAAKIPELAAKTGIPKAKWESKCWICLCSSFGQGDRWKSICPAWSTGKCTDNDHATKSSPAHTFPPGAHAAVQSIIKPLQDFR